MIISHILNKLGCSVQGEGVFERSLSSFVRIEGVVALSVSAGTDFLARRFRLLQDRCNKTCKSGFCNSHFLVCVIHRSFARELARLEASIYIV